MVKKTIFVFVLLLSLLLISVHAEEKDCISYFYGEDCQGCEQVNAHLNSLQTQYPGLQIQKFEVYYNPDNLQTLRDYFTAYKISQEKQVVPSIFVSGSYFVGTQPILDLLEQRIGDNTNEACPTLTDKGGVGVSGKSTPFYTFN